MCVALASLISLRELPGSYMAGSCSPQCCNKGVLPSQSSCVFWLYPKMQRTSYQEQKYASSFAWESMLSSPFPEICLLHVRRFFLLHQKFCLQLTQPPALLGGRTAGLQPINSRRGPRQRVFPHFEPLGCYEAHHQRKCEAGSGRGWGP